MIATSSNALKSLAIGLLAAFLSTGCASKSATGPTQIKAAFWPQYPDPPHIQYLCSFNRSVDVEPPKSKLDELVLGKESQQVMPLNKPYGVEMWNGRIYICDIRNNCVDILDLHTHQMLIMGKAGSDAVQHPTDIAIASDGMKYVTDQTRGRVCVFDAQDRQLNSFRVSETWQPVSVATFGNEIYVCDFASQTVGILDRFRGTYIGTIGKPGPNDGQFIRPLSVDVDSAGNIYVMDMLTCRLQKFDRSGKLLSKFGTVTDRAGGLVRPKQIAVDKDGQIFIVDAAFQNVQVFDQQGYPLTFFGSPGDHPGAMHLPVGICVHEGDLDLFKKYIHPAFQAERLVLVTNQFGDNKVAVYAVGHLAAGKTVADVAGSQGIVPAGTSAGKQNGPAPLAQGAQAPDEPATKPAAPLTPGATPTPIAPTTPTTPSATTNPASDWQRK